MDYKQLKGVFPIPISNQQRSYQYLELCNGLLVLVITDPSEQVGSCCLTISAGHHSDPNGMPGLAHLCEHMVCISSKKYPSSDLYRKNVEKAGGNVNAVTNSEMTSYYFSIPIATSNQENLFETILDIFSSNFTDPLFNAADSNREIYAVDNEHNNNKTMSHRVSFYGYKLLANSKHPFSRFSTGNFDSLIECTKKYDIHNELQSFFKENYLPEKMTLVIRGPQSLNYLRKIAVTYFSSIGSSRERSLFGTKIINKSVKFKNNLDEFNISELNWASKYKNDIYATENLGRGVLIDMKLNNNGEVRIGFPIKLSKLHISQIDDSFFMNFWCEIMGDESIDSLGLTLKEGEYISDIISTTSNITFDTAILELKINLLQKGANRFDKVLNCIFQYFSIFSNPNATLKKHIAKSMSQFHGISLYNFLHSEDRGDIVMENKQLSQLMMSNMKNIGRWINLGSTLYDFDTPGFHGSYLENGKAMAFWLDKSSQFTEFMKKYMNVNNMLLSFVGDFSKFKNQSIFLNPQNENKKDIYFGFEYCILNLDNSFSFKSDFKWSLNIPQPNQFAPDIINNQTLLLHNLDESAKACEGASLGYSIKNTGTQEKPKLIYHDSGRQLWIKREADVGFNDRGLLTILLSPTALKPTLRTLTALELVISIINDRINSQLYPAIIMNYKFSVLASTKGDGGLIIHVSGPKENIHKVLAIIIKHIELLTSNISKYVSNDLFEKHRRLTLFDMEQIYMMPSFVLSTLGFYATVEECIWPIDERVEALKEAKFELVAQEIEHIFDLCYLTSFLHGDVNVNEYQNIILPVVNTLVKTFQGENSNIASTVWLPENSNFKISSYTKDASNAITYFIQTNERDDLKERSIAKFVSYIVMSTLRPKLRGEYQLGYIVLINYTSTRRSQGIKITIVNGEYDSATLDKKIDVILMEWFDQIICKMKSEKFNELMSNFISSELSSNNFLFSTMGTTSLSMDSFQVPSGGSPLMAQHKSYWEQIFTNIYSFSNSIRGEEFIDVDVLKKYSYADIVDFIKLRILPNSKKRAKISVLLDSDKPIEEMNKYNAPIQLYIWLSSMGLPIKIEDLAVIMQQSGESQMAIAKNLFKYYRSKGKSITLISGILANLSKSIIFSLYSDQSDIQQTPAQTIDFHNIDNWRREIGVVKEKKSLSMKLNAL